MDESLVIQKGRELKEKFDEKINNDVMTFMRKRDPNFDLFDFEQEIKFVFEQVYSAYLNHDLDYIEKICFGEALGYFR